MTTPGNQQVEHIRLSNQTHSCVVGDIDGYNHHCSSHINSDTWRMETWSLWIALVGIVAREPPWPHGDCNLPWLLAHLPTQAYLDMDLQDLAIWRFAYSIYMDELYNKLVCNRIQYVDLIWSQAGNTLCGCWSDWSRHYYMVHVGTQSCTHRNSRDCMLSVTNVIS